MPDSNSMLDRLVAQAGDLYSLPRVAAEVLELTRDPQIDTRRLKECIENDPALTGKLLRVVNSSLFGLTHHVQDLNQALALLGTTPLKLLVLGFCLPEGLFRGLGADFLARYWQRTLITAVAARQIAEDVWKISGDEPFLAGLLRELGVLVILQDVGEPYLRLSDRARAAGIELCEAERAALGFDHGELTCRLLAAWRLPETIVAAAGLPRDAEHFDQLPPTKRALPQILHLAGLLAELLGEGRTELLPQLVAVGRRYHDLLPIEFDALSEVLHAKVRQLADVLALQLPDGRHYRDVLSEAHTRLSQIAAVAATQLAAGASTSDDRSSRIATRVSPGECAANVVRKTSGEMEEAALWEETQSLAAAAAAAVRRTPCAKLPAPRPAAAGQPLPSHGPSALAGQLLEPFDDPILAGRLSALAVRCRAERRPLSLALLEWDRYSELVFQHGPAVAQQLSQKLLAACRRLDAPQAVGLLVADVSVAILLPDVDRQQAVHMAGELLDAVRAWPLGLGANGEAPRLNIGVAAVGVIPKSFAADDLVSAAHRCLFAARQAGGNAVKSIEL